jgi:CheY-like chemotaxis protein
MKRLNLLLADDDSDDCSFFEEAFLDISPGSSILVKHDGEEVLNYLFQPNIILPDIIFLDLNMPFLDGSKCLEEIRMNKFMNDIFIVMNTTTASRREIDQSYDQGADLFLIKPNSYQELRQSIEVIINLDFTQHMMQRCREQFVFNLNAFIKNL